MTRLIYATLLALLVTTHICAADNKKALRKTKGSFLPVHVFDTHLTKAGIDQGVTSDAINKSEEIATENLPGHITDTYIKLYEGFTATGALKVTTAYAVAYIILLEKDGKLLAVSLSDTTCTSAPAY